jgi:hypothetical protein
MQLVTDVRPVIFNPNKEGFSAHVEADKSASDPCPASGAGASDDVYPERPCHEFERTHTCTASGDHQHDHCGPGDYRQIAGDQG